jgi:hypothetical protein
MPQLIEYIGAIALRKQRDALYVTFFGDASGREPTSDREDNRSRQRIIEWLDLEGYGCQRCGEAANERVMRSYRGSIHIDVPFDTSNADHRSLKSILEHPDGTVRLPEMRFGVIAYEHAMKNAHHVEPGFWARWAVRF